MKYYSTNGKVPSVSLEEAVIKGLAGDKGLYMPERIIRFSEKEMAGLKNRSFHEIACMVAQAFFGEEIETDTLHEIVTETLSFETPTVKVDENIYSLELFHGPTLAFKDVGARFMARLLGYFIRKKGLQEINVLVATSGDTGSAVANGFLGVPGIHVYVLYPKGKVSPIQECQFTTLGQNITALEIDGVFDDCQALVKSAFMDEDLNRHMKLTSANSINVARFLPQSFYYFNAYAQLDRLEKAAQLVVSVPSGNFGNITAGLFAHRMGLPIKRFIAANNRNDVFLNFLNTGVYKPRPSIPTIANAMDVGDPSNFARIIDLFGKDYASAYPKIRRVVAGCRYTDEEIAETIEKTAQKHHYLLDPHGACGYQALVDLLQPGETGVFLETAHPAKFQSTIEAIMGNKIEIPAKLTKFMQREKKSIALDNRFTSFKQFLLNQ